MKTTTTGRNNGIQWTLWMQLDDFDFADDLALLSHNHSQMQDKTTLLETTSAGTGLKINRKKTELMKMNTTANTPVTVGGEPIREVEPFVYLGSVIDEQGGTDRDVTARIGKARAAFVMLKNIWASGGISMRTKLRIFNSNVKSVLLYGCETWRTTQSMQQKIQTFLNTCLRCIYKIKWQEKIRNEDLWAPAGQEPVAKQILQRRWGWIGHILRKPASSTTRQALTRNPQGKRKRGRPRNSWRRDTEAELKQQGTNWSRMTRAAQNRIRWREGRWWPMLHWEQWAKVSKLFFFHKCLNAANLKVFARKQYSTTYFPKIFKQKGNRILILNRQHHIKSHSNQLRWVWENASIRVYVLLTLSQDQSHRKRCKTVEIKYVYKHAW